MNTHVTVDRGGLKVACETLCAASEHVHGKPGVAVLVVEEGRAALRLDAPGIRVDYDLGPSDESLVEPLPVLLRQCAALLDDGNVGPTRVRRRRSGVAIGEGFARTAVLLACDLPSPHAGRVEAAAGPTTSLPAGDFAAAVERTVFVADTESTRYALGGVLVDEEDGRVVLVATDSRRMAIAQTEIPACGLTGALLPRDLLRVGLATCRGRGLSRVTSSEKVVTLRGGRVTVMQERPSGRFPRWRDIVPLGVAASIDLPRTRLHRAIDRFLATVQPERLRRSCSLDFAFAPGSLTLAGFALEGDDDTTLAERGVCSATIPVAYTGEPRVLVFDARFVRDFLAVASDVVLDLPADGYACTWHGGAGYRTVIMPMEKK